MVIAMVYGLWSENVGMKIIGIMISKTNNNGLYWEYNWDNNWVNLPNDS